LINFLPAASNLSSYLKHSTINSRYSTKSVF
jgi:hypothetical protein